MAPRLAAMGVQVVEDVRPFEEAKLRMLNGSHTAIALMGAVMGLPTVADCVANADIRWFVHHLMTDIVMPQLQRPGLPAYRDACSRVSPTRICTTRCTRSPRTARSRFPALAAHAAGPAGGRRRRRAAGLRRRRLDALPAGRRRPGPGLCDFRPCRRAPAGARATAPRRRARHGGGLARAAGHLGRHACRPTRAGLRAWASGWNASRPWAGAALVQFKAGRSLDA
jgi:hypothetical protein